MIKANRGKVKIEGFEPVILSELTGVVQSIYRTIESKTDSEVAKDKIFTVIRLALADDEDLVDVQRSILLEKLEKKLEELKAGGELDEVED